ncbi:MAG: ABC transporter permease [Candidatus Aminicenantes bacterium]|nr:ABC transporter permease [Candidatus Aminicenantes bacterium]
MKQNETLTSRKKSQLSFFFKGVKIIFQFSFFQGKKSKKSRLFALLSFAPIAIALFLRIHQVLSPERSFDGLYFFNNAVLLFIFQFLILVLTLFYGTSVCTEDLEAGTWTYLVTRPIPRPAIVGGKYLASLLLVLLIAGAGLIISFIILNLEKLDDLSLYSYLFKDLGVLSLALMAYTSFFTFLGAAVRRSIFFGLIFSFGWENVIQYFPGSTQRLAIIHYIKSIIPLPSSSRFSFLTFQLEPTKPVYAVFILLGITILFLFLAGVIFVFKEPRAED